MRLALIVLFALNLSGAQTKSPGPKRSDSQIEEITRASYAKSKIGQDHFTVRVKNGIATIEGKTEIIQRKGWATRYARLAGATQIVNNIQISEAGKQKARARLETAREKRTASAKGTQSKPAPAPLAVTASVPNAPTPPLGPRRAILKH